MWSLHTVDITQPEKELSADVCCNVGDREGMMPTGKPDTEGHVVKDSTYMRCPKRESMETKMSGWQVLGQREGRVTAGGHGLLWG